MSSLDLDRNARHSRASDANGAPSGRGGPFVLELSGFGYAYEARVVGRHVDLRVPHRGVTTVMGPTAAGKSSLLRIIAGLQPSTLRTWGDARYLGEPLGAGPRPALVEQKARALVSSLFEGLIEAVPDRSHLSRAAQRDRVHTLLRTLGLEHLESSLDVSVVELSKGAQRCASVARAFASGAALLCIDEPCAGLDDDARARVLDLLARAASERAVLLVTHDRREALALDGSLVLLAGGVVQETAPTRRFFEAPTSAAGEQFVRTGSCCVPSPDARPEDLDEAYASAPTTAAPPPEPAPTSAPHVDHLGVRWVLPGLVAGFRRPGLLSELESDLGELTRARVRALVCLEERATVSACDTARFELESVHHPIDDMAAPTLEGALWLCRAIDAHVREGRAVGVHCRAGLGRTGTVLTAYLLYRGRPWPYALHEVRRVDARFVQSPVQLEFLERFASHLERHPGDARRTQERSSESATTNPQEQGNDPACH